MLATGAQQCEFTQCHRDVHLRMISMVNFTVYIFSTAINNKCKEEENKNEMKDRRFKEMGSLDLKVNFRQGVKN